MKDQKDPDYQEVQEPAAQPAPGDGLKGNPPQEAAPVEPGGEEAEPTAEEQPENSAGQATADAAATGEEEAQPDQQAAPLEAESREEWEREVEQARAQAAENYEKFLRVHAEFENFKKRMHKDQAEAMKYAQLPLLRDLTTVMDNLERAVEHARKNSGTDLEGLVAGIELVIKQATDTFERFGMKRITAKGEAFDPTRHEAMAVVETTDAPENQVIEEVQAGYMLHDRVVRPAMVTVAKRSEATTTAQREPGEN